MVVDGGLDLFSPILPRGGDDNDPADPPDNPNPANDRINPAEDNDS